MLGGCFVEAKVQYARLLASGMVGTGYHGLLYLKIEVSGKPVVVGPQ